MSIRPHVAAVAAACALSAACLATESAVSPPPRRHVDPNIIPNTLAHLENLKAPRPQDPALVSHWANFHTAVANFRFIMDTYEFPTSTYLSMMVRDSRSALFSHAVLTGKAQDRIRPGLLGEGYYAANDDSFQPFLRYVPSNTTAEVSMPLVVFLHGYFPSMNRLNWEYIPETLQGFAEANDVCVAAPFGRSNTDYQGIGEQDVLRVVQEMEQRYPIDRRRVFLSGVSMGGMGVWTIGARHPNRFAGLIPVCGRADYYVWQGVARHTMPSYKQRLIDVEFGHPLLSSLTNTPIFCIHGDMDPLIGVEEARHAVRIARQRKLDITYVELPGGSHWIFEEAFDRSDLHAWIRKQKRTGAPRPGSDTPPASSHIRQAFLAPFAFVSCSPGVDSSSDTRFQQAVDDWTEFAKWPPRQLHEETVTEAQLTGKNVFLFGEPEESALIRKALADSPVRVTKTHYVVGGRRLPRKGHGLYLARPSPWSPERTVIVKCGIAWGTSLSSNHKYDLLPDFIIYSNETDDDDSNTALCAGGFDAKWRIDSTRLYVRKAGEGETAHAHAGN